MRSKWGIAFDQINYATTDHAIERYSRVFPDHNLDNGLVHNEIIKMVRAGQVVLESKRVRYIVYNGLKFPCYKMREGAYKIRTILTPDMDCWDYGDETQEYDPYS